jgi:hypothetical protein
MGVWKRDGRIKDEIRLMIFFGTPVFIETTIRNIRPNYEYIDSAICSY